MRRLVVRGVMGGMVLVGRGGRRCLVWGLVMEFLSETVGGGTRGDLCRRGHHNQLVGDGLCVVRLWPGLMEGAGGGWCGGGTADGRGVGGGALCSLRVWASRLVVWVLLVCAVPSLWSLAGCGAEVWVGRGCLGIRAGLWSVASGWLLVDGACWHGVRLGGLRVVMGCSL